MTMSKLPDISIVKEIEIDRNHIDNYQLETDEGTKRTKATFYKNAVEQRNNYTKKQQIIFSKYKVIIENEMAKRIKRLLPKDKTRSYDKEQTTISNLLNLVKLNSDISDSFKLKIDFIVASISDNTTLDELNEIIKRFIDVFMSFGIVLKIDDFKYTMFTEKYMNAFLENSDYNKMKDIFERIYFTCPEIKLQLKMNLKCIISEYKKELSVHASNLKQKLFLEYEVNSTNVIDKYVNYRNEVGSKKAEDAFNNTKLFLDGNKRIDDYLEMAPARTKNYNLFAINGNYDELNKIDKKSYDSAIMGLYLTLTELKKYYRYEFIIEDLLKRYKEKDNVKSLFDAKKKEIEKEEKNRLVIYKEYIKATGVGFLARKNEVKMKNSMLKMNEQIKKLNLLYEEFYDLEITNNLNKLNDSSSIYDLLMMSLSSFDFLEEKFTNNEEFNNISLEECVEEYFKFIFNPNNIFLRKVNVLVEYNIAEIVSDKYRLLNLNVTEEMVNKENIDSTMESVSFINLIHNIEKSDISLEKIKNLDEMLNIVYPDGRILELI